MTEALSIPSIPSTDQLAADRMRAVLSESPLGRSLGALGEIAVVQAGWQGSVPPAAPQHPSTLIFAGAHSIASRDISAYTPASTANLAASTANLAAGTAAAAAPARVMAHIVGAPVRVIDTYLHDPCPPIDMEDAMDEAGLDAALRLGQTVADEEIDAGADLLLVGNAGVGATTAAAALAGALTWTEPVAIVGPGSAGSEGPHYAKQWESKVAIIRDAMFRCRGLQSNPRAVIRKVASPDIAALIGFIIQAASRRTPLVIGDAPTAVAALAAEQLAPGTVRWLCAGSQSTEPSQAVAYRQLHIAPIFDLGASTGQACGALAALPMIRAACELASTALGADAEAPSHGSAAHRGGSDGASDEPAGLSQG